MSDLSQAARRFVVHWGEMGSRWGVNRSVAQIHALLYLAPEPKNAEEIADTLLLARSNVSTSLKELQSWGLIRTAHRLGDRRDHFEAIADPWDLFRRILEERKRREIDPTLEALEACLEEAGGRRNDERHVKERLEAMRDFFRTVDGWYRTLFSSQIRKSFWRGLAEA